MKQETVRIRNERTLLPEMMKTAQYTCVNESCERFGLPVTFQPLPAPRFTRGKDLLSEKEQARLEQLRKVAMAPGLEGASLKVIDAITTYLAAGHPVLMEINQGAASEVVRTYAGDALGKMSEESRGGIVTLDPGDIVVTDRRTKPQRVFKIPKSEWTPEDESKYVPPNYSVNRGKDYTPQWLAERLRGNDLQAELLRLFRDHPRIPIHDGPLLGWRSLKDTAEGIAIRLGREQSEVRRELDRLLERGILYKTEKMEYLSICEFPPKYPSCRICHQPMKLLDEEEQKWYCYRDDQAWYGKEQRWQGPTQDALRLARLPSRVVQVSPRLLQQLAADSQREIELTCRRLLQQVAIESEFEITSLKVIEAIETLEAVAIPALIEIANRAVNSAVRNYAHDTIIRIMDSRKEPKQTNPEQAT